MIADLESTLTKEEFEDAVAELDRLVREHVNIDDCDTETVELVASLKRIVQRRRGELTLS